MMIFSPMKLTERLSISTNYVDVSVSNELYYITTFVNAKSIAWYPWLKFTFENLTFWDRYFTLYFKVYLLQVVFLNSKYDFWIKFHINVISCFPLPLSVTMKLFSYTDYKGISTQLEYFLLLKNYDHSGQDCLHFWSNIITDIFVKPF